MFTLTQALEAIKDKPEFSIKDKGEFTVIDYNINTKTTFVGSTPEETKILLNLRGTAFDNETGKISRLGYHKFFNYGENPDLDAELDFSKKHIITQKLDGSCLYPIMLGEGYVWGTRAGPTDVSKLTDDFLTDHPLEHMYDAFIEFCLDIGFTPIFEYCSKENRVVLDYPETMLVLTGIRNMNTGDYSPYSSMVEVAKEFSIPVVKSYSQIKPEEFKEFMKTISELENDEGVVIRFEEGPHADHMIKIKSKEYVMLHKTLDSLKWEHDAMQLVLNGLIDDIIPILDKERAKKIQDYASSLIEHVCITRDDIVREYSKYSHIEVQKYFAIAISSNKYRQFMFTMRNKGIEPLKLIMDWCKKTSTNQSGALEMKRMIGFDMVY